MPLSASWSTRPRNITRPLRRRPRASRLRFCFSGPSPTIRRLRFGSWANAWITRATRLCCQRLPTNSSGSDDDGGEPDGGAALNEVGREQVEKIEIVGADLLLPDPRKHHGVVEERVAADASARKPDHLDPRPDAELC